MKKQKMFLRILLFVCDCTILFLEFYLSVRENQILYVYFSILQ